MVGEMSLCVGGVGYLACKYVALHNKKARSNRSGLSLNHEFLNYLMFIVQALVPIFTTYRPLAPV